MPIHPETLLPQAPSVIESTKKRSTDAFLELLVLVQKDTVFLNSAKVKDLVTDLVQVPLDEVLQFAQQMAKDVGSLSPPVFFARLFSLARQSQDAAFFARCVLFEFVKNRKAFPLLVKDEDQILSDYFVRTSLANSVRVMYQLEKVCPEICKHFIKYQVVRNFEPYKDLQEVLIALYLKQKARNLVDKESRDDVRNEALLVLRDQELEEKQALEIFSVWLGCHSEKLYSILTNVRQIKSLEIKNRQAVSTLVRDFGVYNFARYSTELLLSQVKEKDQLGKYLLLVYPKNDHNGAFTQHLKEIDELQRKLPDLPVRVIEVDGVAQLIVRLSKLRKKYGKQSIAGGVVGGHGSEDRIRFGNENSKKKISREVLISQDVELPAITLMKEYMAENPHIILVSCSTGRENGIAQKISRGLDATVVAPTKPTNLNHIFVQYLEGVLRLHANYEHDNVATSYTSGVNSNQSNI